MDRRWRIPLIVVAAGTVLVPAAAAGAGDARFGRVPVPQPEPFSAVTDCYRQCSSPAVVRTTTPRLTVSLDGPAGAQVRAEFEVRTAPSGRATLVTSGVSGTVTPPATAEWQAPDGALIDGSTYYWRARTLDERPRTSMWTEWQHLTIDTARPDRPTVSSQEYPEQEWGAALGTEGTFVFSATAADTTDFTWSLDAGATTTTPATGDGPRTASVTITPPRDLVNVLSVAALDVAGNRSDTYHYQFYVTPPPNVFAHWTLDEPGGTSAADSGTVGATGTLSGAVAFAPAYVDGSNGAWFTGDGGQISTEGQVLDSTRSFTVMAWVNPTDLSGGHTVVSQDGFWLGFAAAANGGAGGWCFTMHTAPESSETVCADGSIAGPPTPEQWVHLAATYDAAGGEMAVYVMGGELACIGESARGPFTSTWSGNGPFLIGAASDGRPWLGGIDDVYAHQRRLEDVEICQEALR